MPSFLIRPTLSRFAIVEPTVQRWSYPELGRHGLHHLFAKGPFAQNELRQLRPQAEERHPDIAGVAASETGGIAAIVPRDDTLFRAASRIGRQSMGPGFRNPDLRAVRRDNDAERPRELVGAHARLFELRIASDKPSGWRTVLHQIREPKLRRIAA